MNVFHSIATVKMNRTSDESIILSYSDSSLIRVETSFFANFLKFKYEQPSFNNEISTWLALFRSHSVNEFGKRDLVS